MNYKKATDVPIAIAGKFIRIGGILLNTEQIIAFEIQRADDPDKNYAYTEQYQVCVQCRAAKYTKSYEWILGPCAPLTASVSEKDAIKKDNKKEALCLLDRIESAVALGASL